MVIAKTNGLKKTAHGPVLEGDLLVEYYFHPNYGLVTGINLATQGGNVLYSDTTNISVGDR